MTIYVSDTKRGKVIFRDSTFDGKIHNGIKKYLNRPINNVDVLDAMTACYGEFGEHHQWVANYAIHNHRYGEGDFYFEVGK